MFILYSFLVRITGLLLHLVALFNKKMQLFLNGRKHSWDILEKNILANDRVFWIHVASLGEYEQGLPLMEQLRKRFPSHKIVLTFFSPSGYEVKKNNSIADATLYLPLDTRANAQKFLKLAHPEKAFFIKYEFWPNYLRALKKQNINTYLISGILRPDQVFFKWYGGFYRKALTSFSYFFVQNQQSADLLEKLNYKNTLVVGDTRFDRVIQIVEANNYLDFVTDFKNEQPLVVVGSSWPQDETLLINFINSTSSKDTKYIFAPHNIKPELLENLTQKLTPRSILYSQKEGNELEKKQVLIVDAYSLLTKIYSYADIAYIGGGFGTGIHNILEAATFGVPIIIGPNYKKFQEAKDLIQLGGCLVVNNQEELTKVFQHLLENPEERRALGRKNQEYVLRNKNATQRILDTIFPNN